MTNSLIQIENNNMTFFLKKEQVKTVALENKGNTISITILAGNNSKFEYKNFQFLESALNKFNEIKKILWDIDFVEFGSEQNNLFYVKKSNILSFVELPIFKSDKFNYHLVDVENNRYFLGQFSQSEFVNYSQKFL